MGLIVTGMVSSKGDVEHLFLDTDVVIDFSSPSGTVDMLAFSSRTESNIPLVIGTTGLGEVHDKLMQDVARHTAIFYSPNMSIVVAIMNELIKIATRMLDTNEFDAEIFEAHHKGKRDAPSGTALMFGNTIATTRNQIFQEVAILDRAHHFRVRQPGEIGFASQRGGNIVGTHEVSFSGEFERLAIRHEANSKELFARGAIRIATWLRNTTTNGLYTMSDYIRP
jgi:4-hydroxy-tetrahydrodipicolinate reductase